MEKPFFFALAFSILLIASSCQGYDLQPEVTHQASPSQIPSSTPEPTQTNVPSTPTENLISQICSPLRDITLYELVNSQEIIQQQFETPFPGNDFSHTGVDYGFYRFKDIIGIEGMPILAAIEGTVVTVLNDRYPLGYTVIIETPIENLDPRMLNSTLLPTPAPTVIPDPRMNCPPGELNFDLDYANKSLYILYAHMKNPSPLQVGDHVACGQQIGEVGNTGWSSNPHLHFETRVGPSGARFESMAYYTSDSTQSERYNWCVWRVSNLFQLFDPMNLLSVN